MNFLLACSIDASYVEVALTAFNFFLVDDRFFTRVATRQHLKLGSRRQEREFSSAMHARAKLKIYRLAKVIVSAGPGGPRVSCPIDGS